jgi:HSP20 family protein
MTAPIRQRNNDALTRWNPFADLNQLASQMERLFQNADELKELDGFIPLADIEETDDAYVVELELPGVKRKDINVELDGNRLIVTGERKERERKGVIRRRTRTVGEFRFEVVLPNEVAAEGVEATLDEGVLTVRVPKAGREQPRRVEVK